MLELLGQTTMPSAGEGSLMSQLRIGIGTNAAYDVIKVAALSVIVVPTSRWFKVYVIRRVRRALSAPDVVMRADADRLANRRCHGLLYGIRSLFAFYGVIALLIAVAHFSFKANAPVFGWAIVSVIWFAYTATEAHASAIQEVFSPREWYPFPRQVRIMNLAMRLLATLMVFAFVGAIIHGRLNLWELFPPIPPRPS